jgi:hypothetical protein
MLFRTEAAAAAKPRVVWADIGKTPRALVLESGNRTVPLNSCYVTLCPSLDDAHALSALLNSSLVASWLAVVAEPARGGYRRFLGWTMSMLPIPMRWEECRDELAAISRRSISEPGSVASAELLEIAIAAFGLRRRDVEPLLAWGGDRPESMSLAEVNSHRRARVSR